MPLWATLELLAATAISSELQTPIAAELLLSLQSSIALHGKFIDKLN